jgi:hypothetical protein
MLAIDFPLHAVLQTILAGIHTLVLIASKQMYQYFWSRQCVGDTKITQNNKYSFDLFCNKLRYVLFIYRFCCRISTLQVVTLVLPVWYMTSGTEECRV